MSINPTSSYPFIATPSDPTTMVVPVTPLAVSQPPQDVQAQPSYQTFLPNGTFSSSYVFIREAGAYPHNVVHQHAHNMYQIVQPLTVVLPGLPSSQGTSPMMSPPSHPNAHHAQMIQPVSFEDRLTYLEKSLGSLHRGFDRLQAELSKFVIIFPWQKLVQGHQAPPPAPTNDEYRVLGQCFADMERKISNIQLGLTRLCAQDSMQHSKEIFFKKAFDPVVSEIAKLKEEFAKLKPVERESLTIPPSQTDRKVQSVNQAGVLASFPQAYNPPAWFSQSTTTVRPFYRSTPSVMVPQPKFVFKSSFPVHHSIHATPIATDDSKKATIPPNRFCMIARKAKSQELLTKQALCLNIFRGKKCNDKCLSPHNENQMILTRNSKFTSQFKSRLCTMHPRECQDPPKCAGKHDHETYHLVSIEPLTIIQIKIKDVVVRLIDKLPDGCQLS